MFQSTKHGVSFCSTFISIYIPSNLAQLISKRVVAWANVVTVKGFPQRLINVLKCAGNNFWLVV